MHIKLQQEYGKDPLEPSQHKAELPLSFPVGV